MMRFRQLLAPGPFLSPGEEQEHASAGLPAVVRNSNLRWNAEKSPVECTEKYFLISVAPYSQQDLILLDLLDEKVASAPEAIPVYVSNLQEYSSQIELGEDFPGVGEVFQSPVAAIFDSGTARSTASGKKARELVSATFGFPVDELIRREMEETPIGLVQNGMSSKLDEFQKMSARSLLALLQIDRSTRKLSRAELQFIHDLAAERLKLRDEVAEDLLIETTSRLS